MLFKCITFIYHVIFHCITFIHRVIFWCITFNFIHYVIFWYTTFIYRVIFHCITFIHCMISRRLTLIHYVIFYCITFIHDIHSWSALYSFIVSKCIACIHYIHSSLVFSLDRLAMTFISIHLYCISFYWIILCWSRWLHTCRFNLHHIHFPIYSCYAARSHNTFQYIGNILSIRYVFW